MITSEVTFIYQGAHADELRKARELLSSLVHELSPGDLRLVVCKAFGGSYASCARFLSEVGSVRGEDRFSFNSEQAETWVELIVSLREFVAEADLRKVVTWSKPILEDYKTVRPSTTPVEMKYA